MLESFCRTWKIKDYGIQLVMGKDCYVRKYPRTGIFLAVDVEIKESYTGYKLTERQSQNHEKYDTIGKNYKN